MKPVDFLILFVVVAIIGGALWYIRRAKKKGVKCIGCPDGAKCAGNCSGCCENCPNSSENS